MASLEREYDVVIIGAGSAGLAAAEAARRANAQVSILLADADPHLPYLRTQLSKSLRSAIDPAERAIHSRGWYDERRITLAAGAAVGALDREHHEITVGGQSVRYGTLVLATGAEPLFPKVVRPHEHGAFFVLRSIDDAIELQTAAQSAKRILVAGMGVLAVEVAHQLQAPGRKIALAGATPQLMPRQLTARGSELLEEALNRAHVRLMFREEILSFEPNDERSWTVEMIKQTDHFDLVVFCIGVTPRVAIAQPAGLTVRRGIVVDQYLATNDPAIWAAGDCAEHDGGYVSHLWDDAAAQGATAGANAVGAAIRWQRPVFALRTQVFGVDIFSTGIPRSYADTSIDEFEVGDRYYAFFWREDRLDGAIVLNDSARTEMVDRAVHEGWDRTALTGEIFSS